VELLHADSSTRSPGSAARVSDFRHRHPPRGRGQSCSRSTRCRSTATPRRRDRPVRPPEPVVHQPPALRGARSPGRRQTRTGSSPRRGTSMRCPRMSRAIRAHAATDPPCGPCCPRLVHGADRHHCRAKLPVDSVVRSAHRYRANGRRQSRAIGRSSSCDQAPRGPKFSPRIKCLRPG